MLLRMIAASALLALCGCADPDSTLRDLTRTGRDARYYNPQTGRYEWPEEDAPRRPRKAAAVSAALREQESPARATPDIERPYNPQTGRFDPPP